MRNPTKICGTCRYFGKGNTTGDSLCPKLNVIRYYTEDPCENYEPA